MLAFTNFFFFSLRGTLAVIITVPIMKQSLNFSRVKKPRIEVVFLGKSFLVRERAEVREHANVYSLDSRKGKHAFSTSAVSSLPSGKDKYPRDGPFRRPSSSSRDKTNFSILTSPWEIVRARWKFWGMVGGFNGKFLMIYTMLTNVPQRRSTFQNIYGYYE